MSVHLIACTSQACTSWACTSWACTSLRVPHGRVSHEHAPRDAAGLPSRTYVFTASGGRWPGVAFLILALSGKWAALLPSVVATS
jgi:hypothetical protein